MRSSPAPLKTRRVGERCTLNLSRVETSSRCYGVELHEDVTFDGPRNFEPWSRDDYDTSAGPPSPNYHATPTGGRFSSR
ncbi:hypothetical protein TNCV_1540631 [Trichonephila clavipes]|nr:hypothetical protein TNCV_1540631 [Trichonephila clavipes]